MTTHIIKKKGGISTQAAWRRSPAQAGIWASCRSRLQQQRGKEGQGRRVPTANQQPKERSIVSTGVSAIREKFHGTKWKARSIIIKYFEVVTLPVKKVKRPTRKRGCGHVSVVPSCLCRCCGRSRTPGVRRWRTQSPARSRAPSCLLLARYISLSQSLPLRFSLALSLTAQTSCFGNYSSLSSLKASELYR